MHTATTYKSRTLPTVHAYGTRPFLGLSLLAFFAPKITPAPVGPDPFGPTRDHPTAFTLEAAISGLTVGLVKAKHTLTDTEYRELLDKVSHYVWVEQMEMDQREHPEMLATATVEGV